MVVTLVPALKRRGWNKGVASLCVGGSEATAVALEMIS
jgi:acetyl-CoA C-acetyltransferase